ncbi:MAG: hypothetical protein EXR52_07075 [Dehalococcoidia bacterium]|nr:hypothetical protein [Dehalococcoidia bacterium]
MEWLVVPLGAGLFVLLAFRFLPSGVDTRYGGSVKPGHRHAVQVTDGDRGGLHHVGIMGFLAAFGLWVSGGLGLGSDAGTSGDGDGGGGDGAGD